MKRKRLYTLVCVLLLVAALASFASAEKDLRVPNTKQIFYEDYFEDYTVSNGETVRFILFAQPSWVYEEENMACYRNVFFDCQKPKGKVLSGTSWIHVTNTAGDCCISFQFNETSKQRTGKVRVTGKNFRATLVFTQYGKDRIVSAVRSGKTMTLKVKKSSGPRAHCLSIEEYRYYDGSNVNGYDYSHRTVYNSLLSSSKYRFKVRKGHVYQIGYGPAVMMTDDFNYEYNLTSWAGLVVDSVAGSESYEIID